MAWWQESYDCHLIMATGQNSLLAWGKAIDGDKWWSMMRRWTSTHMPEVVRRSGAKDKGGGWRLQPRSHEGNEDFTTQRAISCHTNLWIACDVNPFNARIYQYVVHEISSMHARKIIAPTLAICTAIIIFLIIPMTKIHRTNAPSPNKVWAQSDRT